jgi:hypothetical protein
LVKTKNGKINKRKNCHGQNNPLADIKLAYEMQYNNKPYDAAEYIFDDEDESACVNFDTAWLTHIEGAVDSIDDLQKQLNQENIPLITDTNKDLEQLNKIIDSTEINFDPIVFLEEIYTSLNNSWSGNTNTSHIIDKKKTDLLKNIKNMIASLKTSFPLGVKEKLQTELRSIMNDPSKIKTHTDYVRNITLDQLNETFKTMRDLINLGKYVVTPPTNITEIDQINELFGFTELKGGSFKRKNTRRRGSKKRKTRKMRGGMSKEEEAECAKKNIFSVLLFLGGIVGAFFTAGWTLIMSACGVVMLFSGC